MLFATMRLQGVKGGRYNEALRYLIRLEFLVREHIPLQAVLPCATASLFLKVIAQQQWYYYIGGGAVLGLPAER